MNATIYCGYCCKTGAGLEKPNIVAAARYYEYGARAGVAAAQYELARIYIDKEMGMLALLAVLIRILVVSVG